MSHEPLAAGVRAVEDGEGPDEQDEDEGNDFHVSLIVGMATH